MELHDGETVKYKLSANLRNGIEFVGGVLTITDQRFLFSSHTINIQKGEVAISINDMDKVHESNALGILSNGLTVELTDGSSHTFIVAPGDMSKREDIVEFVQEKLSA